MFGYVLLLIVCVIDLNNTTLHARSNACVTIYYRIALASIYQND